LEANIAFTFVVIGSIFVVMGSAVVAGAKFGTTFPRGVVEVDALEGDVGSALRTCGFFVNKTPNKYSPSSD
jgi:hypothetical protein